MKIAIDISQIIYEGTGVSVYTKELVRNLLTVDSKNTYVLFAFSKHNISKIYDFLTELKMLSLNFENKIIPLPEKFANIIGNYVHFPKIETFIGACDIYHSSDWIQFPSSAFKVTTVHDLVPFRFPEVSQSYIIRTHTKRLIHVSNECDKIICVSKTTKNDLIKAFPVAEAKISVIYSGVDSIFSPVVPKHVLEIGEKYNLPQKYILAVGTIEPRKNLNLLVHAFMNLKKKNKLKEYKLIIVGKSGWGELIEKNKDICYTGFVPTSDMPAIYTGASLFIYPSLYEGFGLPILESQSCGCPVISSNIGSMKEISEGTAILIDPYNQDELEEKMDTVLGDKNLLNELKQKGKESAKKFKWRKTAEETLSIYTSLKGNS